MTAVTPETNGTGPHAGEVTRTQVWTTAAASSALSVVVGGAILPVAFFLAYAFRDAVRPEQHAVFLTGVVTAAVVTAAIATGVLVCFAYEDEGSVTADQPAWPFLVLVGLCLVVAAAGLRVLATRAGARLSRG